MFSGQPPTEAQKAQIIDSLRSHSINTLTELRRIERLFATIGSPELTEPMTSAWLYYVNSNTLLAELRGLTRNYPFSSECIEEAKGRVYLDANSNNSWNLCWLVLNKIHTDNLTRTFANSQASRPEMWNGHSPTSQEMQRLAEAFTNEWTSAVGQMLRTWEIAPIVRR